MAIYLGNTSIENVYFGSQRVSRIYLGNQLIFTVAGRILLENSDILITEGGDTIVME